MYEFNYKVIEVNKEFDTMSVLYSAQTLPDTLVSMPIPSVDENLIDIVRAYAPFGLWNKMNKVSQEVAVGDAGVVGPTIVEPVSTIADLQELELRQKIKQIIDEMANGTA